MRGLRVAQLFVWVLASCTTADGGELRPSSSSETASATNASARAVASAPSIPSVDDVALAWPNTLPDELAVEPPSRSKPVVVYLDAGHGAKDNPGNTSCFCVEEKDFTESLAMDVMADLREIGGMHVILARSGSEVVAYGDRVEAARKAGADVFLSLHSDIRGKTEEWSPDGAAICRRSVEAPGFAVLYSDEGATKLVGARRALADDIGAALREARFIPYEGAEYVNLYEPIPSETGVFVDRHEDKKRIFILRRTPMPAVIVETHNALDPREAQAFEDPLVRRRFSLALAKGIFDAMTSR